MKGCSRKILNLVKLLDKLSPGGPSTQQPHLLPLPHTQSKHGRPSTAKGRDGSPSGRQEPSPLPGVLFLSPFMGLREAVVGHPGWVWHLAFLHQCLGWTVLYVCPATGLGHRSLVDGPGCRNIGQQELPPFSECPPWARMDTPHSTRVHSSKPHDSLVSQGLSSSPFYR